jgi:diguanylate cyclase (GGDEF)-like protein
MGSTSRPPPSKTSSVLPRHAEHEQTPETLSIDQLNAAAWNSRNHGEETLERAERALQMAERLGYEKGRCEALLARGYANFRLSKLELARRDAVQAQDIAKNHASAEVQHRILNLLAMVHGQSGNVGEALSTFLAESQVLNELGDHEGEARSLFNAGYSYLLLGDYGSSLEAYLRAKRLFELAGNNAENSAACVMAVGRTHLEMGDLNEALGCFLQLDSVDELGPQHRVILLMSLARCYEGLGNSESAFQFAEAAQAFAIKISDRVGLADSLDTLGRLHFKNGDYPAARVSLNLALETKQETGDRTTLAETLVMLGHLHLAESDCPAALAFCRRALQVASEIGSKTSMAKAHEALALSLERVERYKEAILHLREVLILKQDLFDDAANRKVQSLRVTFQVEQARQERELYLLRNIELATANEDLKSANQENLHLVAELSRLADEDALTGLHNRRYFDTRLELELRGARASGTSVCIMMCDIDNFKRVNDSYSHQKGDLVLAKVAELFKAGLRETDVLARYGGEEFVLMMPGTTMENAAKICERLRTKVAEHAWSDIHTHLTVTVSMGLVCIPESAEPAEVLAQADRKLYEAKRTGKNKVCI